MDIEVILSRMQPQTQEGQVVHEYASGATFVQILCDIYKYISIKSIAFFRSTIFDSGPICKKNGPPPQL